MSAELHAADFAQLDELGISRDEIVRQLRLFAHPPAGTTLDRPCTPGDGIRVLTPGEMEAATQPHEAACRSGRLLKFVPASGAASRMFASLLAIMNESGELARSDLEKRASGGDGAARTVLGFIDGIERFAFFDDLEAVLARAGCDRALSLVAKGRIRDVLSYLLEPRGLNYAALPKGLIPFHRYADGSRTAFAEHLVEAALHTRDRAGLCRLHLTVSSEHLDRFRAHLAEIGPKLEKRYEARFEVGFSVQKRSTDTIAVDLENRPFRSGEGKLLLRPGGHGALIENLGELGADVVYVKNIDNVVPDDRKSLGVEWKKILGGLLLSLQAETFRHLARLARTAPAQTEVDAALRFVRDDLQLPLPTEILGTRPERQIEFLTQLLDRPIRVCGMVRSAGDPGGGPFWVVGRDGSQSPQIVEHAQIDRSPEQEAIYRSATHFNPVDLVCGLRDWRGKPFDLGRSVDPDTVFISRKSSEGRDLKALERPGLWNGAMANWTTIFVEVPAATFTPVKTVGDLLGAEHQPRNGAPLCQPLELHT